ncbi:AMP-dependent synthetase/ligase [Haliangium ochraceum]|uniref:AMP-dependent synthetase and ligase n=1 Tax=Haliangium ochraceum (strain DSM 14365 / JCM 11303 / SMP-2) TaxID=502025 RepID=D0LW84_HALO1|nr:long-chain fatty acid--CoA ligase [Haliangium ochraceum]ACY16016.1 AMP-dependent synthetase and ligase [Haliangium ochraceum DSM 14365]
MTETETAPLTRKFQHLVELFEHRVTEMPEREAFRFPSGDSWVSLTWAQTAERVRDVAAGLLALGIEAEDRCAIMSSTRVEWILADLGTLSAGAATTTVYPSTTIDECAHILADSACKVVFAEDDEQVAKIMANRDKLGELRHVVVFAGESDGEFLVSLDELERRGRARRESEPDELSKISAGLSSERLATIIYTSGTTGMPKGVRLSHDCWTYCAEAIRALETIGPDDLQYLWLPLAHSFAKVLLAGQLAIGCPTAVDGRIPKLVENLGVVRPVWMAAAPRIFEKVYNRVVSGAKEGGGLKFRIFRWAVARGRQVSALRQQGKEPRGLLALQYKLAHKLVFSKLNERFGGRVRFFISGSAPLSREMAEFFHAAGFLILEGYGLTETSAASTVNRLNDYKFGSVGKPLAGTKIKVLEEDGELCIRGPGVMGGYHQLAEQTASVLDDEGWLHTGDIGTIDSDGFVFITDRKKDLIKTSGGKYVAPQHIEGLFKSLCPVASQCVVHGDQRNYCTALISLDEESIAGWAIQNGLSGLPYEELTRHQKVRSMVQEYVNQLNEKLASYESIKRFAILPRDLSVEEGELTPSLKVKRKLVERKYKDTLDALYEGSLESI